MKQLKEKAKNHSDSIVSCKSLTVEIDKINEPRHRVAILSNYTVKGLAECLKVKAFNCEIMIDVYEGEYDQWRQEIIGEELYNFNPEVIIILVDFFGPNNGGFFEYGVTDFDVSGHSLNQYNELRKYLDILKKKTKAKIIVANGVKPGVSIMNVLENKLGKSYLLVVDDFNQSLNNDTRDDGQIFVFDIDQWLSNIGKDETWCTKFFFIADMKLSPNFIPALAEEFMYYIVPLFGKKKKCIVLDLDNTLWGGVIGEDGLGGINLGPVGEGLPFYYFQKLLLHFRRRGFLLAICSKNNEADVTEVFEKHPYMVLKENDFVATRINWLDKATNIKSIADELNIGLDSLVFVDDDPMNTEFVNHTLKVVDVITLPKDSTRYVSSLLNYKGLSSLEYTEEDSKRTDMYISDKKRKKLESEAGNLESFLDDLNISLTIKPINDLTIKRSAQLTQKTNQFNLTTIRYTEEDITEIMKAQHYKSWTLEVEDRFGNYGIVGLCVVKDISSHWEIDTLLLSCRVLGRKIEFDFLGHVIRELHKIKQKKIRGKYIPTVKNVQVKDFYKKINFRKITGGKTEHDIWELDIKSNKLLPTNFRIISDK